MGDNLQDHIALGGLIFLLDAPVSFVLPRQFRLWNLASFLKHNEGPLMTTAIAETIAFVNSKTFQDVALYLSFFAETVDGGVLLKNILRLTDAFYSAVVYRDAFSSLGTLLHPRAETRFVCGTRTLAVLPSSSLTIYLTLPMSACSWTPKSLT